MPIEIERKFLVKRLPWQDMDTGVRMAQGYMVNKKESVIRIRMADESAWLTIKGQTLNASRKEFEYPIPVTDAGELLDLFCKRPFIEKIRYTVNHAGFEWVIDRFEGDNSGLVIAEIELDHEDQAFPVPDWIGTEVTNDPRFYNSNLIRSPFAAWPDKTLLSFAD